ncbi:hypothetical protein [Brevibacillus parabrevis]|nr:hypothetical protein [Brevibacillus parabrevis]
MWRFRLSNSYLVSVKRRGGGLTADVALSLVKQPSPFLRKTSFGT